MQPVAGLDSPGGGSCGALHVLYQAATGYDAPAGKITSNSGQAASLAARSCSSRGGSKMLKYVAQVRGKGLSSMTTLRQARAERLLSIRELAKRAAVAPSTVYLIERGRTTPGPRVVRQLSAVLGVEPLTIEEFRQAIQSHAMPARRPPPSRQIMHNH